jgi:hypothetical protein
MSLCLCYLVWKIVYWHVASFQRHIHDPVLSSLKMEGIRLLFQYAFPLFLETTGNNVWRALDMYVTSHEMCATAEIWSMNETTILKQIYICELHARSRDVSRVTKVWICTIEFNVKSPLTTQLHELKSHELTWREDSVSPALSSPMSCALWRWDSLAVATWFPIAANVLDPQPSLDHALMP